MSTLTVRGYTGELYTGSQHDWPAYTQINEFNGNLPKSLDIPTGVKVDLYAQAGQQGGRLTLTTSASSLKGTIFETLAPRSMRIWPAADWQFSGQWVIKANGQYLTADSTTGVLKTSPTVAGLFEVAGYKPLSQEGASAQNVSIKQSKGALLRSAGSNPITIADLDNGSTILQPVSEYTFRLKLKNRGNQWLVLQNGQFGLTTEGFKSTVFTFAYKCAPSEGDVGALASGEVALFEQPGYMGKAWIVWGDLRNISSLPHLTTTIRSVQVGPRTGITAFSGAGNDGPSNDVVSNVANTQGMVFQSLSGLSAWRILDPAQYNISFTSSLSSAYSAPAPGSQTPQVSSVVRTQITFTPGADFQKLDTAAIWTTARNTLTINGAPRPNTSDSNKAIVSLTSQIVTVSVPVNSFKVPLLKIRTKQMKANEFVIILTDSVLYQALNRVSTEQLAAATAPNGQRLFADVTKAAQQANALKAAAAFMLTSPYVVTPQAMPLPTTLLTYPEDGIKVDFGLFEIDTDEILEKIDQGLKSLDPMPTLKKMSDTITSASEVFATTLLDVADGMLVTFKDAAGKAVSFVLDTWEKVSEFCQAMITKIVSNAIALYEWLKEKLNDALGYLDWSDYLALKNEIKSKLENDITTAKNKVSEASTWAETEITAYAGQLSSKIDTVIGYLDKPENRVMKPHSRQSSTIKLDKLDWIFDQISAVSALPSVNMDSIFPLPSPGSQLMAMAQEIRNAVKDQALTLQTLEGPLSALMMNSDTFTDSPEALAVDVLKLIKALLDNVVTAVINVVDLFLSAVGLLLDYLLDVLKTPINIPGLRELYSLMTNGDTLTPLSLISLMIAIPSQTVLNLVSAAQRESKKYEAIGIGASYIEGSLGIMLNVMDPMETQPMPSGQRNTFKLFLEGSRLAAGLVAWMMDAPAGVPLKWHTTIQKEEQRWENIVWWTDYGIWSLDMLMTVLGSEGLDRSGYVGIGLDTFCGATQLGFGITLLTMREKQDTREIVELIVGTLPSLLSVSRVEKVITATYGASLAGSYALDLAAVYTPYVWGIVDLTEPHTIAPTVYEGQLLWYKNSLANGIPQPQVWAGSIRIDQKGWDRFKFVFGGHNGVIYAVTTDGNLLWHRLLSPQSPTFSGFAPNSGKVIGSGGWDGFKHVFGGHNGFVYAVTNEGHLRVYKYKTPDEYTGDNWANPLGDTIASSGWNGFKDVFGGHNGVIYTVTNSGNICWYRFTTPGQAALAPNSGQPIGAGGWNGFKQVFGGVDGVIYAIEQTGNIRAYKYNSPDRLAFDNWASPVGPTIGTGGWNTFHRALGGYDGVIYTITT